jgi:predicted nuclease of predicted toxin-antitoxin system
MLFILDENVPVGVADMLVQHGHDAQFIRDYVPPGSPDPLVATVAQELDAVLLSFDGDFEVISPRIPKGQRQRFRKLSRIWMRCAEPQAARRLQVALSLVMSEYELSKPNAPMRMWIGASYIRTDR